jgi:hypothetical protein
MAVGVPVMPPTVVVGFMSIVFVRMGMVKGKESGGVVKRSRRRVSARRVCLTETLTLLRHQTWDGRMRVFILQATAL